jgi:hypothetical protein
MTKNVRKTVSTNDLRDPDQLYTPPNKPESIATTTKSSMTAQFSDDLRRIQKHFNGLPLEPFVEASSSAEDTSIRLPDTSSNTIVTPTKAKVASPEMSESSKVLRQSRLSQQGGSAADMASLKEMSEVLEGIGRGGGYDKPSAEAIRRGKNYDWAIRLANWQSDTAVNGMHPTWRQKLAKTQRPVAPEQPPRSNSDIAADYTKPFCDFLTDNPTVFHTVTAFAKELEDAGYKKISERDSWKIKKGGKYFVQRNGSSLIAFSVGDDYEVGNGAAMVAGHIDALTTKLKPIPKLNTKAGYVQLGVAPYAGALNSTWWDRDLSIGGRVLIKESSGKITTKLVKLNWPSKHSLYIILMSTNLTANSRPHSNSGTAFWSCCQRPFQPRNSNGPHHWP